MPENGYTGGEVDFGIDPAYGGSIINEGVNGGGGNLGLSNLGLIATGAEPYYRDGARRQFRRRGRQA